MNRNYLLLILLLGFFSLSVSYMDPYRASNLDITPDSTEYAIGAWHIASEAKYFIQIDGKKYPPRYPPWFSMFVISPAYLLSAEIGNGIYPVTFMAVLGTIMAFFIGRMIAGELGGVLSAVLVLCYPAYRQYSGLIMSDVPCAAGVLAACCMYVVVKKDRRLIVWTCAGLLVAFCGALRPEGFAVLVPFAIEVLLIRENIWAKAWKTALLMLPSAAIIAATMLYNNIVFGSPFRNGYKYWCPVPYDYPSLVFSAKYAVLNLKVLWATMVPLMMILAAGIFYLIRLRKVKTPASFTELKSVVVFSSLYGFLLVSFHVIYFYPEARFYIPLAALCCVITGGLLSILMLDINSKSAKVEKDQEFIEIKTNGDLHRTLLNFMIIAVLIILCWRMTTEPGKPIKRLAAESIRRHTPGNSIVISSIDPVYLEFFAGGGGRRFIPISRTTEYASKMIAERKIENPDPFPVCWWEHMCPGLLKGGAKLVVPFTVGESPGRIVEAVKNGVPVFIDSSCISGTDMLIFKKLEDKMVLMQCSDTIFQLVLK
ncbi:MAG: hypothetical protein A2X48_02915 [Lentisphaerae bacterium GWF2_49_21]|nr:MAG: hypothetical protein A2X48_02915 [Lentisphaerae bacterium GWF2_49_21]